MDFVLIIPTLNAAGDWEDLCTGICRQSLAPSRVIVIDSSSTDGTAALARAAGFTLIPIDRGEFSHGGTRQKAAEYAAGTDGLLYLTQDAIPHGTESFRNLMAAFRDPAVGAAYGRQLPRLGTSAIEEHARLFNYPPTSLIRSWESRSTLGFKSIFFSNSFGAYRRDALMSVGGFAKDAFFGEDTIAAACLHGAGWKTAYVADALVEHSHDYSIPDVFKRYFDIGAFHEREKWLLERFGAALGEGRRFAQSELGYLWKHNRKQIPLALLSTFAKYVGYSIGRHERALPQWLRRNLSASPEYWEVCA